MGAHSKPPGSSPEAPSPYNLILLRSWGVHAEDEETGKGHGGSSKIWTQEKCPKGHSKDHSCPAMEQTPGK